MKPWMKYALWFFIGGGIGFFAGQQVGLKQKETKMSSAMEEVGKAAERAEKAMDDFREAAEAIREYTGGTEAEEALGEPATDEDDPEMPMEEPVIDDVDIPQLHPEDLKPVIINEDEYNYNIWHYDLENLLFYEMDEVLYNERTQSVIEDPDQVIGIGTLFGFGGDPNNPVNTLYVKNDTFGTLFRIDRIDAAFCDITDGVYPPEKDDPEEEEDPDDDFWNDV